MKVLPYKDGDQDKKSQVTRMFDNIAGKYDLLNHLLSLNIDRYWRGQAIRQLRDFSHDAILDLATGTGDLAIAALRLNPERVTGIDISAEMLKRGNEKLKRKNLNNKIELLLADAENLPFGDETFDAVISAFGVRNFGDIRNGISEAFRVLKKDGHLIILEFSKPEGTLPGRLLRFYFKHILPGAGGRISGDFSAYGYLPESVDSFPDGKLFLDMIAEAGFSKCSFKHLTLGIVTIYSGTKR